MNNLLEIKNLKKSYETKSGKVDAIENISLDVKEGDFIAIVGSSGCGKSTFLSILANLDKQNSGTIKYNKKDTKVGYMLQEDALFDWLTILDNSTLGLDIMKIKNEENINYVKKLLKTYGLNNFIDKYPNELSGGMKQRVVCML